MFKNYKKILTLILVCLLPSLAMAATIDDQVFVLFGGTGDLAKHKLIPALTHLAENNELPENFVCIGIGRSDKTDAEYQQELEAALPVSSPGWKQLKNRIRYFKANIENGEDYTRLQKYISKYSGNRIFYLSTAASFFPVIIENLQSHKLLYPIGDKYWSRVVIEKPFGHDTDSAQNLQKTITQYLDDSQIYRIDHYLGKEVVQNILPFREKNTSFEKLWNRDHIEKVTIVINEDIGIANRGSFFEETGLLRDVVQNHMMQLLALIAMELPSKESHIIDEKIALLKAVRLENKNVVRGQYGAGIINGVPVLGYRQEKNVAPDSNTETFVAAKLWVDNERWKNVPFYLVAGKRLAKRYAEIIISFKNGSLIFHIQPDEEIFFVDETKHVKVDFKNKYVPEAYERLIHQAMLGNRTNFVQFEELLLAWKLWTPILETWKKEKAAFPNYPAGGCGPAEALN